MKNLSDLSLVYMCIYIYVCRGIYLFVTFIYIGYRGMMLIFSCKGLRHSKSVLLYVLMREIFILVMTAPVCRVTFPFSQV